MENYAPKLALAFPGVGSQHTMMIKSLFDQFEVVRQTIEEASDILHLNLEQIFFSETHKEILNSNEMAQISLFVASMASYRAFRETFGSPHYCIGYSLGEYSALCASGIIEFADGLEIVQQRGLLIKELSSANPGTMMWVINLDVNVVEDICRETCLSGKMVFVSTYDTPIQCSISGHTEAVYHAAELLESKGAIVYPLKMAGPFHSPLMLTAAEKLKDILEKYRFSKSDIQVISNFNAQVYGGRDDVIENLSRQLYSPVLWRDSIHFLEKQNVKVIAEIGPKDVLSFLIRKITPTVRTFPINEYANMKAFAEKSMLHEAESVALLARCLKTAVSCRNRNKDITCYQERVVKPYMEIEQLYNALRKEGRYPTNSEMESAVRKTYELLLTKKLPEHELAKKMELLYDRRLLLNC